MRIGKQDAPYSAICTSDATSITVRGHDLVNGLMGQIDFTSYFWLLVTGDLLGPNLNVMPRALLSAQAPGSATRVLEGPLVPVDGGHTLLVSAIYAAIFLAVAVVLTWRREVKE